MLDIQTVSNLLGLGRQLSYQRFCLDFVCLCAMRAALSCRLILAVAWRMAKDGLLPLLATALMRVEASP